MLLHEVVEEGTGERGEGVRVGVDHVEEDGVCAHVAAEEEPLRQPDLPVIACDVEGKCA